MAPTVTRLILSFALLVATPTLFFVSVFFLHEVANWSYRRSEEIVLISTLIGLATMAIGWVLIWRPEVKWNSARTTGTFVVGIGGLLLSFFIGWGFTSVSREGELGIITGGLVWFVLWLFGTAIVWRETKAERSQRLAAMGISALPCPSCGYNLSGLRESRCPECGAQFTLDQLFGAIDEQRRPPMQAGR